MSHTQKNDWEKFWTQDQRSGKGEVSWSKQRLTELLDRYVKKDQRVLDAGCGSGFFSRYFCQKGMLTVALDFSEKALLKVCQLTEKKVEGIKADLLNDQLTQIFPKPFDLIFSDGLLEHFEPDEQKKIVANLLSVLGPQGLLVTIVPNRYSPWQLIRPFYMPGIKEKPFTLKLLEKIYLSNGLKIIESGGLNVLPFHFSPDRYLGKNFGMLLFAIGKKAVSSAFQIKN